MWKYILHRTQVNNSKVDHDTVLQFNNTQCYFLMNSCLGSVVLARCRSCLNLQQNMSCTRVLECKSTGFSSFFNQRVVDWGHKQFFKFTFPPVRNFFHIGSKRLRETNVSIITLFISRFSRQNFDQGSCYSIGNWNWLRPFEWCSVLT